MLYLQEHVSCRNYEQSDTPTIQYFRAARGESWKSHLNDNKIIFMIEGEVWICFDQFDEKITRGMMIVLPGGCDCRALAEKDASFMVCRLRNNLQLCEHFSLEKLYKSTTGIGEKHAPLLINAPLKVYIYSLKEYISDDIRCIYFFEIKVKELFFLLRNYYTKEELKQFFSPLLSHDFFFSDFVLKNHHKVKNVKEFAELANYSISGFEKRFKRVFNISAYKWMKEQKAKTILHEIHHTRKTFKEIGWDYGFSSPAQFSDFCKSNFGPPGQIREEIMREEILSGK
ncbi:MAG: helix-turn-helix domain-containing protein [Tannerellaceae bacterium]|nr:helix-turn-helix domain-containing protein [Tannerellaceae bacterium]